MEEIAFENKVEDIIKASGKRLSDVATIVKDTTLDLLDAFDALATAKRAGGSFSAATVEFGLDAKQGLLDLRSETARMRLVTRLFRAAIKRLDFIDRAQARARSNGKVHFSG